MFLENLFAENTSLDPGETPQPPPPQKKKKKLFILLWWIKPIKPKKKLNPKKSYVGHSKP